MDAGEFLIHNVHRTRLIQNSDSNRSLLEKLTSRNKYREVDVWYQPDKGNAGWLFAYGFDQSCDGVNTREEELKQVINDTMRKWLQPIKSITNKEIVDNFYYQLFLTKRRDNVMKGMSSGLAIPATEDRQFHWQFIFYCAVRRGLVSHLNTKGEIHITLWTESEGNLTASLKDGGLRIKIPDSNIIIDQDMQHTVLHEVGHAFSLGDTYISLGGELEGQPMSVMSSNIFHDKDGNVILSRDDIVGIRYFYRYHNDPEERGKYRRAIKTLPADYSGSTPAYPAIFEVKQAYHHYVYHGNSYLIAGLKDALRTTYFIDRQRINAHDSTGIALLHYLVFLGYKLQQRQIPEREQVQRDWLAALQSVLSEKITKVNIKTIVPETASKTKIKPISLGYTALHLATMHAYVPALKLLLATPDIDKNIVDARGKTVLDYAIERGNQEIIALLKEEPAD